MSSGAYFMLINADVQLSVMQNPTAASLIGCGIISGMIEVVNDCIPVKEMNATQDKQAYRRIDEFEKISQQAQLFFINIKA